MIKVENLTKFYGKTQALREVSFEVQMGEVVGLLGPNGAGKSTSIKILTGYLHPDSGTVAVDGLDVLTHPQEVQAKIGYLPENTPLYNDLSVQAYLKLAADMRKIPIEQQPALISEAIYATGLVEHRARPIAHLSKGLRQRVGLAQAILHKPKLLILDEPTVGLDPTQIIEIRHLIRRLAQDSTILFSSHILPEVEAVCDRVIILINGEVKADARLNELSASTDAVLVLQNDTKEAAKKLKGLSGVENVEPFHTPEGWSAYRISSAADICPAVYDLARHENWPVREIRRDVLTLEAVFNQLATAEG
ncbi:MAG: ABC transporter ATP-binding protein [Anaerolineae bacterium]|nr:ABC transporter ATP-binding protein [Anaerolineae bacterium]